MRGTRQRLVAATGLVALALAACSNAPGTMGDKAGGTRATVTLTMGTVDPRGRPDTPTVEYLLQRVKALTNGSVTVVVHWNAGVEFSDGEQAIAEQVRSGQLDLGWVGSRAFDTLGVTSLQAIQAPFLITDNQVVGKVATEPVARKMLSGLPAAGVVGLGLFPDQLRHPVGFRKPLASLADFKGARIRTLTSNASDALLQALGAEPLHLNGSSYATAVSDGTLDGVDASIGLAPALGGFFLTGNVVFFPRMNVLFGSQAGLDKLDSNQRSALNRAASETLRHVVEALPQAEDPAPFCAGGGTVVNASATELTAMRQAAQKVYTELEADSETKANIATIRAIVARRKPSGAPASCGQPVSPPSATAPALVPDGTYTAMARKADALRLGAIGSDCALKADGAHLRLELENGEFTQWEKCSIAADQIGSQGRFVVSADTFTTRETCCGETYFDWTFDGHFLTLKERANEYGSPIDPTSQLIMDHRWEKVG